MARRVAARFARTAPVCRLRTGTALGCSLAILAAAAPAWADERADAAALWAAGEAAARQAEAEPAAGEAEPGLGALSTSGIGLNTSRAFRRGDGALVLVVDGVTTRDGRATGTFSATCDADGCEQTRSTPDAGATPSGEGVVASHTVATSGAAALGVYVANEDGAVVIGSGSLTTTGGRLGGRGLDGSAKGVLTAGDDWRVDLGATAGPGEVLITGEAADGGRGLGLKTRATGRDVDVTSTLVIERGDRMVGLRALSDDGHVMIDGEAGDRPRPPVWGDGGYSAPRLDREPTGQGGRAGPASLLPDELVLYDTPTEAPAKPGRGETVLVDTGPTGKPEPEPEPEAAPKPGRLSLAPAAALAPAVVLEPEAVGALKVLAGARDLWRETGDAWSARITEARDGWASRRRETEAWVQVFGGERGIGAGLRTVTVDGAETRVDAGYDQSFHGVQAGIDWAREGRLVGVTLGLAHSDLDQAGADSAAYQGVNLGAYGAWRHGGFFVDGLAKVDLFRTRLSLRGLNAGADLDGRGWGAQAQTGWRWEQGAWFAEPSVRLSWVAVDLDGFAAAGRQVDFDRGGGLHGEAGGRVGARLQSGGLDLRPSVGLFAVEHLADDAAVRFRSGGDDLRLAGRTDRTSGRLDLGLTALAVQGLEAFVRADALFGGDTEGWGARAGFRWRW